MNWQGERAGALAQARCIVVKVGSAVLAGPGGLDTGVMEAIVAQLALLRGQGRRVVLVSSGAVAAGRAALGPERDTRSMSGRQAAAAVGQSRLMHTYDQLFVRHNLLSAQVLLTRDDLRSRQRFLNIRNTFMTLLDWGAVPVVNENDTVAVQELRFGDNDCLASLLLNPVEAELFVNLTSAGGVFSADPQRYPDAKLLPCVECVRELKLDELCGAKTTLGSGGMYSKLLAARRAAQLGVPTLILPGREPQVIARAFAGEEFGTWVRPEGQSISRRKYWLAYQSDPQGEIEVDDGAAKALMERGSSLLPGGVCRVEGNFQPAALVRIHIQGRTLGVGLSNYSAADLRRIMGRPRLEVAALLGDAHYPEVIHRDNMLLDAAV
ncbi:MAG: glutamate 5-kinase [Deltaproteobacteria bacterium]|jgi:glutamate 5-kinase|nr:glutamate 5-kinase [Deltaproteobacteria bacterium]